MALYAGKVHVQSRLDDTFGLCYHAVNASGYMDQQHFANYIKTEVLPAISELQVTKDTLLSHIVKPWYHTEGCVEKYAFNAGNCLRSVFAKVGLFPFNPDVIRKTVKAHHDPEVINRGIRCESKQDFSFLLEMLSEKYGITNEKDLTDIKEFVCLKQKGISPGEVLACTLQKSIFGEAPKKQRREKNRQLSLSAGALTTHPSLIEELEKQEAEKAAKKVAVAAKRKAPESQRAKEKTTSAAKKPKKA